MNQIRELVKEVVVAYRLIEGGSLILYFGRKMSLEPFLTWLRFCIDCAWRLEGKDQIIAGSLNSPELILPELAKLKGKRIIEIECDPFSMDLCIQFEDNIKLRTFAHSTQDEIWEFRRGDGYRYGIGPSSKPFERMVEPDVKT